MDIPTILTPPTPARSSSPDPARQPSRSPRPYRRKSLSYGTPLSAASNSRKATYLPTPDTSRAPSPLFGRQRRRGRLSAGGSESGTEADDELTKRLPAPPGKRKRTLSEEDKYYGEEEEDGVGGEDGEGRGRRRKRRTDEEDGDGKKRKRRGIVFVRRGIEIGLMGILVGVAVYDGGDGRVWREISSRGIEFTLWVFVFGAVLLLYPLGLVLRGAVLRYPLGLVLRGASLEPPRSLDPAPLLYPVLFPLLVSLSLTEWAAAAGRNRYILANIVLSLSTLPPSLVSPDLLWALSLVPLAPVASLGGFLGGSLGDSLSAPVPTPPGDSLSFLPPLQFTTVAVLNHLLQPSLTQTEIRLVSVALINLLLHASSPQAIILKAILWGGGLGILVTCSDIIKWNIDLARVPPNRLLRRAGNTIITITRLRKLAVSLKPKGQASDSEAEIEPLLKTPTTRPRAKSKSSSVAFYTSLTPSQFKARKYGYAVAVYGFIVLIVMLFLRPYIAVHALDGTDPFLWAPSYLLCGQQWYQSILDSLAPGTGYCVTAGSASAANLRLTIIGYWLLILAAGISLVTALSAHVEVDTRRKVFHGMVVVMFLIPGVIDPQFTHLCLSLALAAFLLLDVIRAGQLPPASRLIARFLQPFVDGRDLKGPVVVSHVFLLLGCGTGWWLTLAGSHTIPDADPWDWSARFTSLSFISGVVSVGLGDAAASLIGRRFGKTKWGWRGGKSLEGSLAFAGVVAAGLGIGRWWIGGVDWRWGVVARLLGVGVWGSLVEAVVTGVNDNIVVPVGAWVLVGGLGL